MATIGAFNTLTIIDIIAHGAILNGGELGEILLPNRYVPQNAAIEDDVDVFLYNDSLDRLVATTDKPKAKVGDFASLKVVQVNKIGAFLDWGLPKDLLVPFNQQHNKMEVDKNYLVHVYYDEQTTRLVASSKIDKFLDIWPAEYTNGEKVTVIVGPRTDLGFKAIINGKHWGLIFQSDIFQPIRTGQTLNAFIKEMRDDGRITLSLSRTGKDKVNDFTPRFLNYLAKNNNFTPLNDKSSPSDIQNVFGVSKKAFKQTVGHCLKLKLIAFENGGIKLINEQY